MTKVLEEKIVSLETQLKDVTATLFKYERRLKDQKLFCDCVAKFFLHKFGFDIWLQLDMLKSALEEASSDSDAESLFPKRISKLISSSRKRHHGKPTNYGEKSCRPRLDVNAGARVGEATSSGMLAASPGIVTPTEVQILRKSQKNSGPVSNDTAGGPSSAHSPSDVIDVDSSDENNVTGVNQIQHAPASPAIPSVNPQDLVKCESEFYDESVSADMSYDDGPDEILGGVSFDGFGDAGNYRALPHHHSLRFAERGKKSRRRNPVWNYFEVHTHKLVCKQPGCMAELKGVVTTNAKKHLKHHHPDLSQQLAYEEQIMMAQRSAAGLDGE